MESPTISSADPTGDTVTWACTSEPSLCTTVVGSYPQPDWLIDRQKLAALGEVRTPGIADVFVALMGPSSAATTRSAA